MVSKHCILALIATIFAYTRVNANKNIVETCNRQSCYGYTSSLSIGHLLAGSTVFPVQSELEPGIVTSLQQMDHAEYKFTPFKQPHGFMYINLPNTDLIVLNITGNLRNTSAPYSTLQSTNPMKDETLQCSMFLKGSIVVSHYKSTDFGNEIQFTCDRYHKNRIWHAKTSSNGLQLTYSKQSIHRKFCTKEHQVDCISISDVADKLDKLSPGKASQQFISEIYTIYEAIRHVDRMQATKSFHVDDLPYLVALSLKGTSLLSVSDQHVGQQILFLALRQLAKTLQAELGHVIYITTSSTTVRHRPVRTLTESNTPKYSAAEIQEYQIFLWTSLVLIGLVVWISLSMCYMDTGRDPQLYAAFQRMAGYHPHSA